MAAAAAAVLAAGCGSSGSEEGKILPSKFYYNDSGCRVEPGCEAAAHDNTVFPRWMFAGTWVRKEDVSSSDTISVDVMRSEYQYTGLPVPSGGEDSADTGSTGLPSDGSTASEALAEEYPDDTEDNGTGVEYAHSYDEPVYTLQVEALPVSLKFDNDSAGGETSFSTLDLEDADCMYVTYQLQGSEDTVSLEAAFDTASDSKGNRLAIGLDGIPGGAPGFENDRLNLTEYDYDFSWTGCELTLSYGKDTAVYVPSMYPDGIADLKDFENYYFFHKPGLDSYEFTYLKLNGNGYGTVNAFDLYADQGFSVQYAFDQSGKLTVERDDGLVMEFPEYWIADHTLTLPWQDGKGGYVTEDSVLGYKLRQDEISSRYLYDIFGFGADAPVGGDNIYIYKPGFISEYIEDGWQVYADLEKSMVPPGAVTEPFEMRYKGGSITARAINRYSRDLPLKDCSVCQVEFDAESGDIGLGKKALRCGEAGADQFADSFDLLYEAEPEKEASGDGQGSSKGKRVMLYKSSLTYFGMGLEDEDYPASEVIPVGPYLESRMEFQDDVLQKVIIRDPAIMAAGMEKALDSDSLNTLNIAQLRQERETRSSLIAAVETAMEGEEERFITDPANGTVILNGEDDKLQQVEEVHGHRPVFYGFSPRCRVYADNLKPLGLKGTACTICIDDEEFDVTVPVPGRHMVLNALAGAAVGFAYGLTPDEIKAGIESVESLSGRFHIAEGEHVTIIDDCYNANPMSMKASLGVLKDVEGGTTAILGDMGELGKDEKALHLEVGEYAGTLPIDRFILIGGLAKEIAEGIRFAGSGALLKEFATVEEALPALPGLIPDGDTVLVKASHFMQFDQIVKALS